MARNPRKGKYAGKSPTRSGRGVEAELKRLGKKILALREEAGFTQEEAAERADLHAKHWGDLENARTNATVSTLVAVARALKVKVGDLFQGPK